MGCRQWRLSLFLILAQAASVEGAWKDWLRHNPDVPPDAVGTARQFLVKAAKNSHYMAGISLLAKTNPQAIVAVCACSLAANAVQVIARAITEKNHRVQLDKQQERDRALSQELASAQILSTLILSTQHREVMKKLRREGATREKDAQARHERKLRSERDQAAEIRSQFAGNEKAAQDRDERNEKAAQDRHEHKLRSQRDQFAENEKAAQARHERSLKDQRDQFAGYEKAAQDRHEEHEKAAQDRHEEHEKAAQARHVFLLIFLGVLMLFLGVLLLCPLCWGSCEHLPEPSSTLRDAG